MEGPLKTLRPAVWDGLAGFLIMSQSRTSFLQLYQLPLKSKQVNAKSTKVHTGKPPKTSQCISIKINYPSIFLNTFFSPNKNSTTYPPENQHIPPWEKRNSSYSNMPYHQGGYPTQTPKLGFTETHRWEQEFGSPDCFGSRWAKPKHCGERIVSSFFTLAGEDGTPLKIQWNLKITQLKKNIILQPTVFWGLFILQGVVIVDILWLQVEDFKDFVDLIRKGTQLKQLTCRSFVRHPQDPCMVYLPTCGWCLRFNSLMVWA